MYAPRVVFFGSSILSAYWNGAATYYRGLVRALDAHGIDVTFYEPDAYDRQRHRDLDSAPWMTNVVYEATEEGVSAALTAARGADVVIKTSGVGVFDELLERAVLDIAPHRAVFWDVDSPATLARVFKNPDDPFRTLIPKYALVFTYGGGPSVVNAYKALGARECVPIYNAVDPTTHHPAHSDSRFAADAGLLVNRLPDREQRIEEFFFKVARLSPERTFLLGGNGWTGKDMPPNVTHVGHVHTADHNAFNCSPTVVMSVNRKDMARTGYSPATRIFEAAGAGACVLSDEWAGLDTFFEIGTEILSASSGEHVATLIERLTPEKAHAIGRAARLRVLSEHTYAHRVKEVLRALALQQPGHKAVTVGPLR